MAERAKLGQTLGPIRIGIRKDLTLTRQVLRGSARYVIHDPLTFKNHTFDPLEYRIISGIVPSSTLGDTFENLVESGHLDESQEDEFYRFVLVLHGMSILNLPITNADILYERHKRKAAARRPSIGRLLMYYKVPLLDPDRFLDRTVAVFGKLFTRTGFALWAGLFGLAIWKCWGRLGEMFGESASLLSIANIPVLYVALVLLKVIHEFGHAFACKRFGGEVPEMGVVFILGAPCAYVDASSSWKFPGPWQRIVVAMGGMYVEALAASVFALIWAATPPGFLHDVAVNVLVLASLVTVLFNINPLMRFDGYFVLTDLVGTPNLWERSSRFIKENAKRLFLGLPSSSAELTRRERSLYSVYGVASVVYKFFLAMGIVTMVMMTWPVAGTALGLVFGYMMLVQPLLRLVRYLLRDEETHVVRGRARALAYGTVAGLPFVVGFVPLSWNVVVPGILEAEDQIVLRAPADGFVRELSTIEGLPVRAGQTVVRLENQRLAVEVAQVRSELQVEGLRRAATDLTDPVLAPVHRVQEELLVERLHRLQRRVDSLEIQSPIEGLLVAHDVELGAFVRQGERIGEVLGGRPMVRIVLSDKQLGRAWLSEGDELQLKWNVRAGSTVSALVRRILPSASRDEVPSALTVLGGGDIYGTARPDEKLRADQSYLHVLLEIVEPDGIPFRRTAGLTALVKVPARVETLGGWMYRHIVEFYRTWQMS